jgi:hypothetical protein
MRIWIPLLLAMAPALTGQTAPADPLGPVRFLEGRWVGEASGQPGKGRSERTYKRELGGRFLAGTNRSVYEPRKPELKAEVHEDLSYFSFDRSAKQMMLRQFHSEGFVNEYKLTSQGEGKLEFTTFRIDGLPEGWRARESYRIVSNDEVVETFSVAEPGKEFQVYSETRLKRAP